MVETPGTYEADQVVAGRVTRVAEFGAFVELEPGIEGLAHVSTFAPTGDRRSACGPPEDSEVCRAPQRERAGVGPREPWAMVHAGRAGNDGGFEILSIDLEKKRSASPLYRRARRAPAVRGQRQQQAKTEDRRNTTARRMTAGGGIWSLADKLAAHSGRGRIETTAIGNWFWAAVAVSLVVSLTPWAQFILYPFRLFTTWVHECGHALMTVLVGGRVASITI